MPTSDERLRQARFLFIAAMLIDLAGVGLLVLPILQDEDIMQTLPYAIVLFMLASGLVFASVMLRKKASNE